MRTHSPAPHSPEVGSAANSARSIQMPSGTGGCARLSCVRGQINANVVTTVMAKGWIVLSGEPNITVVAGKWHERSARKVSWFLTKIRSTLEGVSRRRIDTFYGRIERAAPQMRATEP